MEICSTNVLAHHANHKFEGNRTGYVYSDIITAIIQVSNF